MREFKISKGPGHPYPSFTSIETAQNLHRLMGAADKFPDAIGTTAEGGVILEYKNPFRVFEVYPDGDIIVAWYQNGVLVTDRFNK